MTRVRAVLLGGALVGALFLPGEAWAVDPTPSPVPAVDPGAGPGVSPAVSPPSRQQIEDARAALDRLREQGRKKPATITQVAGPTSGDDRTFLPNVSNEGWWTLGAGLLVLLVASETTRVRVRRAKHRKGA